ncbi:MAG: PEGA domain-containing protein [Thermoanaerobaculia bacterium]
MSTSVLIDEAGDRRPVEASQFPLELGGAAADIRLPGVDDSRPQAFLGYEQGEIFIQPAPGSQPVVCNGTALKASQWLRHNDRVRIGHTEIVFVRDEDRARLVIHHLDQDEDTEAPLLIAPPRPETERVAEPLATVRPAEFTPGTLERSAKRRWAMRPVTLVFWGVLATLGVVAWFMFTARSVQIEIEPTPEIVEIEGGLFKLEVSGRYLLRSGTYTLVAEAAGYRRLEAPFEVSRDPRQTFQFSLERLPGFLDLATDPATGATVTIDGEAVGKTPLEPLELAPGEHTVLIRAARHLDFTTTVTIEGGGATQALAVELVPLWAPVTFDSRPAGAVVRVDGDRVGTTPVTIDIGAGTRAVEMALAGYKPFRRSLEVVANQPQTLPLVTLVPADGKLLLTSGPGGATVTVDDEYRGQTPLDLVLAPGRQYEIGVAKAGYGSTDESVTVRSGETRELRLTLEPQYGEIEIQGEPRDAEIFVDGELRGPVNQTLRLIATPVEIEIRKEGHESHRQTVTPRPGFPQSIRVSLKTPDQVKAEATPSVIRGPQGQELRLIEPGRFRMGASRREPGRRANETLREVELTRRFYLSTQEVSNRDFRQFKSEHQSGSVGTYTLEIDHHPVVNVTWEEAARYCNWLSEQESLPPAYVMQAGRLVGANPMATGYRLPTEAEWAWAARFAGGRSGLKYPWGGALPIVAGSGNYGDAAAGSVVPGTLGGYRDGFPTTSPVDSYEPNAVGILNLGGNVAEWVHDIYTIYPTASSQLQHDPMGPEEGELNVIRGSSWMDGTITELRLSYRDYGNKPRPDVGFRIARYAE